jgi:hypothetical protein
MKTKTLLILALSTTLLAATAVYAQDDYFNPEIGNGRYSAVEPPVSPAVNDGSYFNAESGNWPAIDEFVRQGPAEHTIRAGKLQLPAAIMLGDVVLPAGKYSFRQIQAGEQQFIEFSHTVTNNYAPEGQSVYQQEVVARVNATPEVLALAGLSPQTTSSTEMASVAGK